MTDEQKKSLVEEIGYRNEMHGKASDTISTTSRMIGIGLSTLIYSILFNKLNQDLYGYKIFFARASMCGVAVLTLDFCQNLALMAESAYVIKALKKRIKDNNIPGEAAFSHYNHSIYYHIKKICFFAKLAFLAIGIFTVFIALWHLTMGSLNCSALTEAGGTSK